METTIFDLSSIPVQFDDITSSLTKIRSEDTLVAAKMIKFGNMVVGQFRITLGSNLSPKVNFLSAPLPINMCSIKVSSGIKISAYITSAGNIRMSGSSNTVSSGSPIYGTFCYILREDE